MAASVTDQITKLEAARQLVLSDSTHYSAIVPGILQIIGAHSPLEIRRWGAEFLAETFASPVLPLQAKETLSIGTLQTLKELLDIPGEDAGVLKSVIQAAASTYGLVFRYIINNSHDTATWDRMATIKSNILKRWDAAPTGVRLCCIKFVQRVVQVQTPGIITDPRRPEQNEISLALVPRDHPLIPPPILEAEASGLLDRLLNVFHEETSDAVLVNATLNCLGILVRTRQSVANKIISTILNFNPLKQTNSPMSPKAKVQIKSMERTTRAFLMNIYRRSENGPFAARIKQHVDRLHQSRLDIFDEGSRKRGAPVEPTDGLDDAKRARLSAELTGRPKIPPLPPGPTSIAQLYTLTSEEGLTSFDVKQLPIDLVVRIALPVLQRIHQGLLDEAINSIRSRYMDLSRSQQAILQQPPPHPIAFEEEDEDYEPDFEPTEDNEQILNKVDVLPPEDSQQPSMDIALGPFKLKQPPPLSEEEVMQRGKGTINRVFNMIGILDEPSKAQKPGLHRLAGSNYDREAWITVITRLATRASAGLSDTGGNGEEEVKIQNGIAALAKRHDLCDGIRETLWKYIIEDFRVRIPIAISWLNEEWYNDRIQALSIDEIEQNSGSAPPQRNYEKWVLKVLDGIVPYLDAKDKVLIRFLSEIPGVNEQVLERVKGLARDPERVALAVNAIYYLVLLKPPVRDISLDALEDLWRHYDGAKALTTKLLSKWRPHILGEMASNVIKTEVKESSSTPALGPTSTSTPVPTAATSPGLTAAG